MKIVPYQSCRAREGWYPVRVQSSSGEHHYTVLVSPWKAAESICECKGYQYRGECSHQETAARRRCRWDELSDPEQQDDHEYANKVCPRCEGPTRWEVEVVED